MLKWEKWKTFRVNRDRGRKRKQVNVTLGKLLAKSPPERWRKLAPTPSTRKKTKTKSSFSLSLPGATLCYLINAKSWLANPSGFGIKKRKVTPFFPVQLRDVSDNCFLALTSLFKESAVSTVFDQWLRESYFSICLLTSGCWEKIELTLFGKVKHETLWRKTKIVTHLFRNVCAGVIIRNTLKRILKSNKVIKYSKLPMKKQKEMRIKLR